MPAVELLGMMELYFFEQEQAAEQERAKAYLQYAINTYTAPSFGKPSAEFERSKAAFEESLKPEHMKKNAINTDLPGIEYGWDAATLQKLKELSEGGE